MNCCPSGFWRFFVILHVIFFGHIRLHLQYTLLHTSSYICPWFLPPIYSPNSFPLCKDILEMGGGAGDLIAYDISEESANRLYQISEHFIVWMNDMVLWSEEVMSNPNLAQYFN